MISFSVAGWASPWMNSTTFFWNGVTVFFFQLVKWVVYPRDGLIRYKRGRINGRFNGRRMRLEVSFCECPGSGGHEKTGILLWRPNTMKKGEPGPFFDPSPGVFENKTWMKLTFFSPSEVLKSWFQTLQTLYVRLVPSRVFFAGWNEISQLRAQHQSHLDQDGGLSPVTILAMDDHDLALKPMVTTDSHVRTPPDFPSSLLGHCWWKIWTPGGYVWWIMRRDGNLFQQSLKSKEFQEASNPGRKILKLFIWGTHTWWVPQWT